MNKGILFIVLLATVAIVVTGCTQNSPFYSKPPSSAITNPSGGGGSSGSTGIECYTNDDCGTSTAYEFCTDEGDACVEHYIPICINPGTEYSQCNGAESTSCANCYYGCEDGACIIGSPVTYQGVLDMLESCIATNSALYYNDSLVKSCDGVCASYNEQYGKGTTCIFGTNTAPSPLVSCNTLSDGTLKCMCCEQL